MILQVCTQAICNMITNNATAIDFIWKIWMSNEKRGSVWSFMLSKSNSDLITSTLVLIINCIRGNKERWYNSSLTLKFKKVLKLFYTVIY